MKTKHFKKLTAFILTALMAVSCISGVFAIDTPDSTLTTSHQSYPITYSSSGSSYTVDYDGFKWSDGNGLGACADFGTSAPADGTSYGRVSLGSTYEDGDLYMAAHHTSSTIDTAYAFRCFYYGEKSYASLSKEMRSCAVNLAIRRIFYFTPSASGEIGRAHV